MVLVSYPVCPQGAKIHVSFSVSCFFFLSVAMEECNKERERERQSCKRSKRRWKSERRGWSLVPAVVLRPPVISSARAVGGRRLSSCDAHNQFFCRRRRGTGLAIDRGVQRTRGIHV